jgi:hypothetical protein
MKKILFLDVDGVICSEWSWHPNRYKENPKLIDPFDQECLKQLYRIIEEGGITDIVISSCWRYGILEKTKKEFSDRNFKYVDLITGETPHLRWYWNHKEFELDDIHHPENRGMEIEIWLSEHMKEEDYNYLILDDDTDMLYTQRNNFIKTDSYKGLMEKHVKRALKILKRKI